MYCVSWLYIVCLVLVLGGMGYGVYKFLRLLVAALEKYLKEK